MISGTIDSSIAQHAYVSMLRDFPVDTSFELMYLGTTDNWWVFQKVDDAYPHFFCICLLDNTELDVQENQHYTVTLHERPRLIWTSGQFIPTLIVERENAFELVQNRPE